MTEASTMGRPIIDDPIQRLRVAFGGCTVLEPGKVVHTPSRRSSEQVEEASAVQRVCVAFGVGIVATPEEVRAVTGSRLSSQKVHLTPNIVVSQDDLENGSGQRNPLCGDQRAAYVGPVNGPTFATPE